MNTNQVSLQVKDGLFKGHACKLHLQTIDGIPSLLQSITSQNNTIHSLINLYPFDFSKQKQVMQQLAISFTSHIHFPVLLEFYHMAGDFEEIKKMIAQLESSSCQDDRTWASLYLLLTRHAFNDITPEELIAASMDIHSTTEEMKLFSMILHLYGLHDMEMFDALYKISSHVLLKVENLENDYLRDAYRTQLLQIHASSNLLINQLDVCKETCKQLLAIGKQQVYPAIYANVYHALASSYLFTDYTQVLKYLELAEKTIAHLPFAYIKEKRQNIHNTLSFCNNLWGCSLDKEPDDPSEIAHQLIKLDKLGEARFLLETLYEQQGFFTPFQEFYYALATKDKIRLQLAKEKFSLQSSYFYLQLFSEKVLKQYNFL
ncbi:AimR family lysis-lysogeny pheromone receptor [Bacillus sp. 1P06AnD]|uniref:AimR family lysis-lysogeny pheromone receptor n=1 Tax=Bacillus sp. 1P06AnD TaxID=3132208 RepID=UPI0039A00DDC